LAESCSTKPLALVHSVLVAHPHIGNHVIEASTQSEELVKAYCA
jgi:hypothetical protein